MLLKNIPEDLLCSWKEKEDITATRFYESLCQNKFDIYFSFVEKKKSLLYEAISKENEEYCSFYIGLDRMLTSLDNTFDSRIYAFARYLYEKEKNMSEEEVKAKYQLYSSSLLPLVSLSVQDAKEKQEMLPLFKELSRSLFTSLSSETKQKTRQLSVTYMLSSYAYDEDVYFIRLSISYDKKHYLVKDSYDFASNAIRGGMVSLFKETIPLLPSMFSSLDLQIFHLLLTKGTSIKTSKYYYSNGSKGEVVLDSQALVDFFFLMDGLSFEFDREESHIDSLIQEVKFSLYEEGTFQVDPYPYGTFLSSGLNGCLIHPKKRLVSLLRFKTRKELALYAFMNKHPDFCFDLFQDEMASDIIPLLEENIEISPAFKEAHPVRREIIEYYVTYTDEDTLELDTRLINGDEEVSLETFLSHPLGETKYKEFIAQLDLLSLPLKETITDQEKILRFLRMDLSSLLQFATVFYSDNIADKKIYGVGKLRLSIKSNIDWLDLELGSDVYTENELELILNAYRKKKKYVRLRNQFVSFDEQESENFVELMNDFSFDSLKNEHQPIYSVLKLSSYSGENVALDYSKEIEALLNAIRNFKELEIDLDENIKNSLREYQVDGVKWLKTLSNHSLSGILADDMGLGKTLEIIALLSLSKEEKPILIVSPKSLIYNWEHEFKKWNPSQEVQVIDGFKPQRNEAIDAINTYEKKVYILSYDTLRNDLDRFEKILFSYLILDEGQNIVNVYAKKTKAVKELQAQHKFVLTGTPIQNSLMDLWSIFDFLMPGYLSSYQSFYRQYGKLMIEDQEQKELLMKKVMPFVLKRTKKEVLKELPPKEETVMMVSMNEEQRKLYDAYLQRARSAIDEGKNKITILAEITRLREICVDPSIFLENFDSLSEKLITALSTIKNAIGNGHKVLVFSTFARTLMHVKQCLLEEGITPYFIYGETSAKERLSMADDFNENDDVKVMLVSLKAGGTGLNLIGADIVIHLDPWWNLAAENQASDRAYRIGQKRAVTILKLICKNSIEERVLELQDKKKELSTIISEGEEGITSLTLNDIQFLLEE